MGVLLPHINKFDLNRQGRNSTTAPAAAGLLHMRPIAANSFQD
jgi:hypothetical protein